MNARPKDGLVLSPGFVDDDGTFELIADARSGAFSGSSSAWFDRAALRAFAERLVRAYPLSMTAPIELTGGYIGGSPDGTESMHVRLQFYAVGGAGVVGCWIRLATPTAHGERSASQRMASMEILSTYVSIERFCKQLIVLADAGRGEARLDATEH